MLNLFKYNKKAIAGFTITELLVAIIIGSILMLAISYLISTAILQNKMMTERVSLNNIKWLIRDRLDCKKTLKITNQLLPLNCEEINKEEITLVSTNKENFTNLIKNSFPNNKWKLRTSCSLSKKSLSIEVYRDKLGTRFSEESTIGEKQMEWIDLFAEEDGGHLCAEYFRKDEHRDYDVTKDAPCKNAKTTTSSGTIVFAGVQNERALCCRLQKTKVDYKSSNAKRAKATCNPNEYVLLAGSKCQPTTGFTKRRQQLKPLINGAVILGSAVPFPAPPAMFLPAVGDVPAPPAGELVPIPHTHTYFVLGILAMATIRVQQDVSLPAGGFLQGTYLGKVNNIIQTAYSNCNIDDWGILPEVGQETQVLCCPLYATDN